MKLEPLSTNESLKDWFGKGPKGDWVRVGTDGKIKGDCAREPGEGKPKCMPRSKAHSMSKKDRATSARRKRRQDPQVDRPGTGNKPINVKTDVKEKCWDGWKQMGMKKKGKKLVPNCVKEQKPSGKATKPYSSHGIPKDATKAELKAIRSNPNSSKGKKQLAHWKLNMHKEDINEIATTGLAMKLAGTAAKAYGPAIAKAAAAKAAPYVAGAAAAYGAKKAIQKKMRDKRDEKIAQKAVDAYVKQQDQQQNQIQSESEYPPGAEADMNRLYKHRQTPSSKTVDAMYKEYQQSEKEKRNKAKLKKVNMVGQSSQHNEGTYMGTFDKKAIDKYMSKKKKAPKPASDEYKRKLAKAYGIRKEAMMTNDQKKAAAMYQGKVNSDPKPDHTSDIKKRLQAKSNRVGDAKVAKKMQKVAFRHRTEAKDGITKKEKYMMTGRHLYDPKQGLQLEAPQDKGLSGSNRSKMDQLFRMGLIAKDERQLFLRALKRGSAALKDPLLRNKLYELLRSMMKIVTDDQQIYRQFRQYVQMNKRKGSGKGAFDVQEALVELNKELLNKSFEVINISEDMSGMSVSSGHKRSVAQGAGMTKKGVAAYRRRNPGSKLQTAVTTPPSKLKAGSKAAKRRKAFCSRSRSWTSDRGKAARRRWNC